MTKTPDEKTPTLDEQLEAFGENLEVNPKAHNPEETEAACVKLVRTAFDRQLRYEVRSKNDHEYVLKQLMKVLSKLYPRKRKMDLEPEERERRSQQMKGLHAKGALNKGKKSTKEKTAKPSKAPAARPGARRPSTKGIIVGSGNIL